MGPAAQWYICQSGYIIPGGGEIVGALVRWLGLCDTGGGIPELFDGSGSGIS